MEETNSFYIRYLALKLYSTCNCGISSEVTLVKLHQLPIFYFVSGNVITGNKMDSLNLATLFAPNLMHSFNDDLSKGNCPMSLNLDRKDHVSALKLLMVKCNLVVFGKMINQLNTNFRLIPKTRVDCDIFNVT